MILDICSFVFLGNILSFMIGMVFTAIIVITAFNSSTQGENKE